MEGQAKKKEPHQYITFPCLEEENFCEETLYKNMEERFKEERAAEQGSRIDSVFNCTLFEQESASFDSIIQNLISLKYLPEEAPRFSFGRNSYAAENLDIICSSRARNILDFFGLIFVNKKTKKSMSVKLFIGFSSIATRELKINLTTMAVIKSRWEIYFKGDRDKQSFEPRDLKGLNKALHKLLKPEGRLS